MTAPTLRHEQIEALYARHGRTLLRYVSSLTFGDRHLAEDIVQETFLRAWRTPALVTGAAASCHGWLTTVARNMLIDRLRHRARRPQEAGGDSLPFIPDPICDIDRVVMSLTVRRALGTLTPAHRHILVELYFRQRTPIEVATRLGVPIGTVKSRAHYAARALRHALQERQPAERHAA